MPAAKAHSSRDALDRLARAATVETPIALRRRLLLERAAQQLRTGAAPVADAATVAGSAHRPRSPAPSRGYGAPPATYESDRVG